MSMCSECHTNLALWHCGQGAGLVPHSPGFKSSWGDCSLSSLQMHSSYMHLDNNSNSPWKQIFRFTHFEQVPGQHRSSPTSTQIESLVNTDRAPRQHRSSPSSTQIESHVNTDRVPRQHRSSPSSTQIEFLINTGRVPRQHRSSKYGPSPPQLFWQRWHFVSASKSEVGCL